MRDGGFFQLELLLAALLLSAVVTLLWARLFSLQQMEKELHLAVQERRQTDQELLDQYAQKRLLQGPEALTTDSRHPLFEAPFENLHHCRQSSKPPPLPEKTGGSLEALWWCSEIPTFETAVSLLGNLRTARPLELKKAEAEIWVSGRVYAEHPFLIHSSVQIISGGDLYLKELQLLNPEAAVSIASLTGVVRIDQISGEHAALRIKGFRGTLQPPGIQTSEQYPDLPSAYQLLWSLKGYTERGSRLFHTRSFKWKQRETQ